MLLKDLVWIRDGRRCSYVAADGTRCSATVNLELDHIQPYGIGGGHEAGNIRVLCRTHNAQRAEYTFGKDFMAKRKVKGMIVESLSGSLS